MVVVVVCTAEGLAAVGAVELVIRHRIEGGHLAAELVSAFHAHVDQSFAVADEVFADHVSAVGCVAVSGELAVCVLAKTDLTL